MARPCLPAGVGKVGRKTAGASRIGPGRSGSDYIVTDGTGYIPVPSCPVGVKSGTLPVRRMGLGAQVAGITCNRGGPSVETNGAGDPVASLAEGQVFFT